VPPSAVFLLLVLVAFVGFVFIESRRQRKKYGPRTGARAIGAGMLDVQQMLQADRKVEMLQKQEKREDVVAAERHEKGDE